MIGTVFRTRILAAVLAGTFPTLVWIHAAEPDAPELAARRPNVVIFLADDLGWGDLGCYGHPIIQTPNLDAFAKEGVRLTHCYSACSVCSPSRSAILTGRTPYRNGVWRWIPEGSPYHLRASEIALPQLLKEAGYATCHVGKWHLNGKFNSPEQPQPSDHGYDHWFATQNNAGPSHKNPVNFVRNGKPVGPLEGYSATLVAEEACTWLKSRPDDGRPFFMTVWTHEPHLPIESDPTFMAPYESSVPDADQRQHHGNVTQLDAAFGRLMKTLDELGVAEETFVVFTADNGPEGDGVTQRNRGSTGGLRGRKRSSFEGGIRVAGIVRWPGRIEPGTESAVPVIGSDWFTTVCRVAAVDPPGDRVLDGADVSPIWTIGEVVRREPLYWRNHLADKAHAVAMREGKWKIVGSDDLASFELYDLEADEQETNDVAARFPEDFQRLKQKLIEHDREVLAEGPDWWKNDPQPDRPRAPRPAAPKSGAAAPKP